jgi:hypothetical protein
VVDNIKLKNILAYKFKHWNSKVRLFWLEISNKNIYTFKIKKQKAKSCLTKNKEYYRKK